MGFTSDESLLNDINLDSIRDYKQYIEQLRPIMLEESGFKEVTNPQFTEGLQALESKLHAKADEIYRANPNDLHIIQHIINANPDIKTIQKEIETYKANTAQKTFQKTPERLALEQRYKALEEKQLALTEQQFDRQQKALRGEIPNSGPLMTKIEKEFQALKENEARAGNIIMGSNIEEATGKGTAANEALRAFRENVDIAKKSEIDSIVNQTPFAYGGFELAAGATGSRAYAAPGFPDVSGLSQLTLGAQQPFQFNRQLDFQMQQLNIGRSEARKNRRSQLLAGGLGLGATAAMAFAGGPAAAGAMNYSGVSPISQPIF